MCGFNSDPSHTLSPEAAKTREDQRLSSAGGRIYQEPGTPQTPRRKT